MALVDTSKDTKGKTSTSKDTKGKTSKKTPLSPDHQKKAALQLVMRYQEMN